MNEALKEIGNMVTNTLIFLHCPAASFMMDEESYDQMGPVGSIFFGGVVSLIFSLGVGLYNDITDEYVADYYKVKNNASRHENSSLLDWVTRFTSPAGYLYFNMASDDLTSLETEGTVFKNEKEVHIWGDDVIKFKQGEGFSYDPEVLERGKFMVGERWSSEDNKYNPGRDNQRIDKNTGKIRDLQEKAAELYSEGKIRKAQSKEEKIKELKEEIIIYKNNSKKHKSYALERLNEVVERLNDEYHDGMTVYSKFLPDTTTKKEKMEPDSIKPDLEKQLQDTTYRTPEYNIKHI